MEGNAVQAKMKKDGALFNAVLLFHPLSPTRLINNEQGLIPDFTVGKATGKRSVLARFSGGAKATFVQH